jgi:putative ABC transport system permease protein
MKLIGAFMLAWRYVARHRVQSLLLAGALGIVMALPLMVRVVVTAVQEQMRARAISTPLVAGPAGSATDLFLTALHFRRAGDAVLPVKVCETIRDTGLAAAIPLNLRFQAQGAPIVGTELDYFDFRGLKLAEGKMLTRLGDCVLGANVAKARGLHAGGAIFSSPEQVFDLAGVYPLKMRVVGVLQPTGGPDDEAVFVDLKTTWLIQGIAHGHDDLAKPEQAGTVLAKEAGNVVGSAAVRMFAEVTDRNEDSFHFHVDEDAFPIHAVILQPTDAKSEALLVGRYQKAKDLQVIRPVDVLEMLLSALFRVEKVVVAALAVVAAAAVLVAVLVFGLSFRLRQREFRTLAEIGVSKGTLLLAKVIEVSLVGGVSVALALAGRQFAVAMAASLFSRGLGN